MLRQLVFYGAAIAVLLTTTAATAQPAASARVPIPPPAASIAAPFAAPPLPGDATTGRAQPPSPAAEAGVDRRINVLRLRLGISAAQLPLWEALAHAMREDALSTDVLLAQRAAAVASMSAVDNMNSYARVVRTYADNTERLANAFYRLYVSLSPAQRRAADTLVRRTAAGNDARR